MDIQRSGSQPSGMGPGEWFTGRVRIDPLFQAGPPARVGGKAVDWLQHVSDEQYRAGATMEAQ
ncbi:MAG TPA: hypothetical protein VFK69_02640 [Candidatus Eisenbacteria bacterium]|nr:hypothetical protein [Candidatus Eisenbacteria bacterium]